jgi:hypothetical protein
MPGYFRRFLRNHELRSRKPATMIELDSDFSPTYIAFVNQDRLNTKMDRLNVWPSIIC